MTRKIIKTALFTVLVLTLMIPFSGIHMVGAVNGNSSVANTSTTKAFDANAVRNVLNAKETETTQKLLSTPTDKKLHDALTRIGIMKQLVDIKVQIESSNNEGQIANLEAQAHKLLSDLDNSYMPESREIAKSSLQNMVTPLGSSNVISWFTNVSRFADCYNPNTVFGTNGGFGTSSASGISIPTYSVSYPLVIGTGVIGNCSTHNGSYTYDTFSGVSGSCYVTWTHVQGTTHFSCTYPTWNDVVVVTTQAYYTGGSTFAGVGWTIMIT